MFHVHGIKGHLFSGTLEQSRLHQAVMATARSRRAAPADARTDRPAAPSDGRHGVAHDAALAYGASQAAGSRQPLSCVADVMRSPVLTVPATATLSDAFRLLAEHGIGQAPVLDEHGALVGLVGRAELMPLAPTDTPDAPAQHGRSMRPVTEIMWTPVPSVSPETDLRRVAALLLDTGLPGVPVHAARSANQA